MARSEQAIAEQFRADGADHTDRVFRSCCGRLEAAASLRDTLAQSLELLAQSDAMLARGGVFIRDYYKALK